jgi:peptidoglycan/LPS O-acetylase OafA/YrhL
MTAIQARKDTSTRLAALDGLRLLAALSVAAYHYTVSWRLDGHSMPEHLLPRLSHVTIYGFLGVETFFLISGFVICLSSWGRRLGDFFTSRVSRLYPAYWVCVVITAVIVTLAPVVGGVPVTGRPDALAVGVNLTMLQEPLGVPSVDTVYWTLFIELRFYLLFALVVWRGLTYRRTVLFCALWMTAALIAPSLHSPLLDTIAIPAYAPYFVAGIAMYLIHRFGPSPLPLAIVGFSWLVCLQRVTERVADVHPGFAVPRWPGVLVVTLAYAVLLAVALGWANRIRWRWLPVAGSLTYPFYLLHQRIGYSVIRHSYDLTHLPVQVLIPGTMAAMLVPAWLVHRYVERPLQPRMRAALRHGIAAARPTGESPDESGCRSATCGRELIRRHVPAVMTHRPTL